MTLPAKLIRRYLLPAFAASLGLLTVLSGSARAEYGELRHLRIPVGEGSGEIRPAGALSFGVDATEGSYYVADEPTTGVFRIQRFNVKGEVEPAASISFAPPEAKKQGAGEGVLGNGGLQIAVDPKRNRIYALLLYERRGISEKEEKEEEKEEKEKGEAYERFPLDAEERAAAQLYAFEYTGGKLVSASTNKEGAPSPVVEGDASGFDDQGEVPKEALLNPRGLAVDPLTGNVLVVGDQDQQQDVKVEKEEAEKECRAVVQFVTIEEASKKIKSAKLAHRFVDQKSLLSPEEPSCEPEEFEADPYSPIVSPGGRVLAEVRENEVWEFPAKDEAGEGERETRPKLLFTLNEQQELLEFGAEETAGPTTSFVPEAEGSSEGKLYLAAGVRHKQINETTKPAVLVVHYAEGEPPQMSVIGWTAGASSEAGHEGCAIPSPTSGRTALLGGFKGADGAEGVQILDTFQHEEKASVEEFEFGPEGSAAQCPHASATPPSVKVDNVAVSSLAPGQKAALSSEAVAADVTSVEWQFEDVTTHQQEASIKGGYEFEPNAKHELVGTTSGEHVFLHEGRYKITEILLTDSLASPEVEVTRELSVERPPIGIELSAPTTIAASEQAARLEATIVDHNEPAPPHLKYVWRFGDGAEVAGETASVTLSAEHTYASPCSCSATLEVTDATGAKGSETRTIFVRRSKAEEVGQPPPPGGGGGGPAVGGGSGGGPGSGGVQGVNVVHNPEARLASTAISVRPNGALAIKVTCPHGETSCIGSVTLRTLKAVSSGAHKKKAVLTLASGAFTVAGGATKALTLHLSSRARSLLAHSHLLRAQASLVAHDSTGVTRTVKTAITLRLTKSSSSHKR